MSRKILRDDIEVPLDQSGEHGLFAEFEHEDILKKLRSQREENGREIEEKLTLDQTTASGHYQCTLTEEVELDIDGPRLFKQAIQKLLDVAQLRNVCDFCGVEQTNENKVINGPVTRICAACLKLCREVLDEEGF